IVVGSFDFTVNFGGGNLTSTGGTDIFVTKRAGATGAHLWSKRFGSTSNDTGYAVAVDSSNNVYVAGSFQGTVNFGGGNLTSAGAEDIFVLKLNGSDGSFGWQKRLGAAGTDVGRGIAVDGSGNLTVTGEFRNTVDFGG